MIRTATRLAMQRSQSELARDILSYFLKHPEAQDTLQGVVEWWLLEERIHTVSAEVEAVLKDLVEKKWVREFFGPDNQVRYAIRNDRIDEITQFINSGDPTASAL